MQIVQANDEHVSVFAKEYADLMHSTGAVTYDYQFGSRELFELIVNSLWQTPGTLFGFDVTTLTLDEGELLRIEVGFHAPGFEQRKKALGVLWAPLIEQERVSIATLKQIAKRTYQCSYLNAAIPASVYYIHALAVKPSHQGRGIGAKLVANAIENGRRAGLRALHLDVLSDNPAVNFYRTLGMGCLVESTATVPQQFGVPMEMRMAIDI